VCYTKSSPVVTIQHLRKVYRRAQAVIPALVDVSLEVPTGTFCAVMGPSGCGKSTLLNLVAGLDAPTGGDIRLAGRSIIAFTDRDWTVARRELIGMVFQSFHLLPGLSAAENVAVPLALRGESGASARRRVDAALELVGMRARAHHRPGELSGGEQQRVGLARAIVHEPSLVLADEPTGNLDSAHAVEIVALLRRLVTNGSRTVLMATHSDAAAAQADHRYHLKDGLVIKDAA